MSSGRIKLTAAYTGLAVALCVSGASPSAAVALPSTGIQGLNLIAEGPGGVFGSGLFLATIGGAANRDGSVLIVQPDGTTKTFLTGIDAGSVAFDNSGVFGGGMFVSDLNDQLGAGKIWRIRQGATSSPGAPQLGAEYQSSFGVELFANFAQFGRLKAFQITISSGEQGFGAGMYVTSGPAVGDRGDRIVFIDTLDSASILHGGFLSNETLVFAQGEYGSGILVAEPRAGRITRLLVDGTTSAFATLGTLPFGPAQVAFNNGKLYVSDFTSGNILSVDSAGGSKVVASLKLPNDPIVSGVKPILPKPNAFIVGTFTAGSTNGGLQEVALVPEPASWVMLIAGFGLVGAATRRQRLAGA